MAETGLKMDFQQAFDRLDGLAEVAKQHLPRSIAVRTGQVFRDEARARAPRGKGTPTFRKKVGPRLPLAESIYLAYSEGRSIPEAGSVTYSVTWNAKKAPHGHLLEFGHWRYNRPNGKGGWMKSLKPGLTRGDGEASHEGPGKEPVPVWTAARPFLRPAYDAVSQTAVQAGLDRGRERMTEILANPAILDQYK